MKQQLKSKRSKELILEAGLALFSKQGYRATSMKEIAERAEISIGRVYHHFTNKLEIFTTLLDRYWGRLQNPDLKLNQLILSASFPDDFTDLALAIEEIVRGNQDYIMLIYIDVIEFSGEHIKRFYGNMADRFRGVYGERFAEQQKEGRFKEDSDPLFAVMLTFRFFFHYFLVETSFGVEGHFGLESKDVIEKARQTILHGLLAKSRGDKS